MRICQYANIEYSTNLTDVTHFQERERDVNKNTWNAETYFSVFAAVRFCGSMSCTLYTGSYSFCRSKHTRMHSRRVKFT